MSNCYLKKLNGIPGKLVPPFEKYNMEYNFVLSSHDNKAIFEIIPEYSNDFYRIVGNNEEQCHMVHVGEGSSKVIEIVVFSEFEDNSRTYIIYVSRLSSKIAFLDNITIHQGRLVPSFNSSICHYTCTVGAHVSYIKMHFEMPDSRCLLQVNKEEPKQIYDLNFGITSFNIKIHSLDETHSKKYLIDVYKREIPRYIFISDPIKRLKFEDPISLSPIYCPMRIPDFDIWPVLSLPSSHQIHNLKRVRYGKSVFEHKMFSIQYDADVEKRVSECKAKIPLTYGGFSNDTKLSNLGALLHKCNEPSPFKTLRYNKKSVFLEEFDLNPPWQTALENHLLEEDEEESDGYRLLLNETMVEYFFYLPSTRICSNYQFPSDKNPVFKLQRMLMIVLRALQGDPENSEMQLMLAFLLEEKFMIEDTLNVKSELFKKSYSYNSESNKPNNQAKINEICAKVGFTKNPTLCQQLRTLLDEHGLLVAKAHAREADTVHNLYEWKAKEASQEGKISMLVSEDTNALGQAAMKYYTALRLDLNSVTNNFHAARMMIFEGKYGEAIIRLEHALTLDPNHLPSKFLIGLAQGNLVKLTDQKLDRTIELLLDGTERALMIFSSHSVLNDVEARKLSKKLFADEDNFFRFDNPLIGRGMFALAKLLLKKGPNNIYLKPLHAFHIALHVIVNGWAKLSTGHILCQFEYLIIECHEQLNALIGDEMQDAPTEIILRRCEWLNAFITSSVLPTTQRMIEIQENICRILVFHQPCNEFYLINLGMVLLKKANMFPFKHIRYSENIKNAILTFRNAVEVNGKPVMGTPSQYLQGLSWFRVHRINYLTKKAPIVICESFRLIEDIEDESLRNNYDYKPKPRGKRLSMTRNMGRLSLKLSREKNEREKNLKLSSFDNIIKKPQTAPKTCQEMKMRKYAQKIMRKRKPMTSKQLANDKISLFQCCHLQSTKTFTDRMVKKENLLLSVANNPTTHYSRLMLGRAYRANRQYIEAVKCFNFIRKITPSAILKASVNREMIEILMDSENYVQALDFMSKIHISENKISREDILLCNEIIKLLIKMSLFEDERLEKYCVILARHDGLESIENILRENNLDKLRLRISAKLNS